MNAPRDLAFSGLSEARADLLERKKDDLSYSFLSNWIERHARAIQLTEVITGSLLRYNLLRHLRGHERSTEPDVLDAVRDDMVERLEHAMTVVGGTHVVHQNPFESPQPSGRQIQAVDSAPSGLQSALTAIIESARNDPAQLRRLVYEVARANLEKQASRSDSPLTPSEIVQGTRALEAAIARVEASLLPEQTPDTWMRQLYGPVAQDDAVAPAPQAAEARQVDIAVPVPTGRDWSFAADASAANRMIPRAARALARQRERILDDRPPRRVWLWFIVLPMILLAGGLVLRLAFNTESDGADGRLVLHSPATPDKPSQAAPPIPDATRQDPVVPPPLGGLPLPTAYGVYAVSGGQLYELQSLPIRVPDTRVMLSADITRPSQTIVPDGSVVFILYRRELVNNAPEKMSVRIVARIAREMTFATGKAATAKVDGSWRIRSNAFALRVAPIAASAEMILVRPENDVSFPAGRYALVHNGLGYDFTVDGPVTAAAHCLERVETANGTMYSECRTP